jgi:hypothetical protein
MKESGKPPKYFVLCKIVTNMQYIVKYVKISKIQLKYNGPSTMNGQHFCSLYVYKARDRICNYIEIRALVVRQLL